MLKFVISLESKNKFNKILKIKYLKGLFNKSIRMLIHNGSKIKNKIIDGIKNKK